MMSNAELICSALADDYVWNDPREGQITAPELTTFLAGLKGKIDCLQKGHGNQSHPVISKPLSDEGPSLATGWWRFIVPRTRNEGVSCVDIRDDGVIREHRADCGRVHY